jgi:putative ABC transport system permease protein
VLQDLRYALRFLARRRGFTLVGVLTLALGVGVNAAVFSVADAVLFRPLPFPEADRLFVLRVGSPTTGEVYGTLPGTAVDAARTADLFDSVAAAWGRPSRAYVRRAAGLDVLSLTPISPEFLDVLAVRPAAGRRFDASDNGTRAVMLSHRTWMQRYGGDQSIVGATLPVLMQSLDGATALDPPLHVVGILPAGLRLPLVYSQDGMILSDRRPGGAGVNFPPLVRLKPGLKVTVAQQQLAAVRDAELVAGKSELRLVPLREDLAARQDPVLWLLVAAAAIVLLVACTNLANLMLARGSARERELAVRAALGGSRARLMRLLLVEAGCIAVLGTAAGVFAGYAGFRILATELPPLLATIATPVFDVRVLTFATLIACAATALFSVVPAWRLSRADARGGFGLGTLQTNAPRRGRRLVVALQVAICVTLVIGAGLVGRSLLALITQNLGFASHRVEAKFDLPTLVVRRGATLRADMSARAAFMQARLRDVRSLTGVHAAAMASAAPFSGAAPDAALTDASGRERGGIYSVSSGYVRTMGLALLAGRDMTEAESSSATPVAILNESAARMICGAPRECLGRIVASPRQPARTVIGVVGDLRQSVRRSPQPAMYVPFGSGLFALGSIVIDFDDTPATRAALKRALSASPDVRVELSSLDEARDRELSPYRFNALVVGAFAFFTLALSIVGVYGVMAAIVGERTREYGIRVALGATRDRVTRLVLRQAAAPIVSGVVAGLLLSLWGSRFIASLLFGITPFDAPSFAAAAGVVVASGIIAALLPARRAARVDPMIVLRAE